MNMQVGLLMIELRDILEILDSDYKFENKKMRTLLNCRCPHLTFCDNLKPFFYGLKLP